MPREQTARRALRRQYKETARPAGIFAVRNTAAGLLLVGARRSEMRTFEVQPVAFVRGGRSTPDDDFWGGTTARIELADTMPAEALRGIEAFSHLEIVYLFDRVDPAQVVAGARHPRGNPTWPLLGIFAQRGKDRPNRIGCTIVRLVDVQPRTLVVEGLDALDGTPVLDIKPVFAEYLPDGQVTQPPWSHEIMRDYWSVGH